MIVHGLKLIIVIPERWEKKLIIEVVIPAILE
jgi:hypothetical protein